MLSIYTACLDEMLTFYCQLNILRGDWSCLTRLPEALLTIP